MFHVDVGSGACMLCCSTMVIFKENQDVTLEGLKEENGMHSQWRTFLTWVQGIESHLG